MVRHPKPSKEAKMAEISYGDYKFDHAELPMASLVALAQSGLSHELGNVVASGVVADIRKTVNPEKPSDVTTEAVKAWRAAHPEQVAAFASARVTAKLEAIRNGTLGVSAPRGPSASADPLTAEMRKLAREQITAILEAAGMKFPGFSGKGDARKALTVTLKGKAFTGDELIANRLDAEYPNNNREAIEREAKRNLDARAKAKAKMAEGGVDSL